MDKLNHIGGTGHKEALCEDISLDLKRISKLDSEGKNDSYIYN
jgi:hypothetical protein